MTLGINMESMTIYGFITFVIDFVGVRFLFQTSFHNFMKHSKKYDVYDYKSP